MSTLLIGQLKKWNPAKCTISPVRIVEKGNLELKTSFGDKTVNGLSVSIKASTSLEMRGFLKKKTHKWERSSAH